MASLLILGLLVLLLGVHGVLGILYGFLFHPVSLILWIVAGVLIVHFGKRVMDKYIK